jgi:hypothetical protein
MANLIGKNVLIVDEVDDTRTTLEYAVRELEKDVEAAVQKLGRQGEKTNFSIFVLHNKDKGKKGKLPQEILKGRYCAARTVGDVWINYPWEATCVSQSRLVQEDQTDLRIVTLMSTIVIPKSRSRSKSCPLDSGGRRERRQKHGYLGIGKHLRVQAHGVDKDDLMSYLSGQDLGPYSTLT